ncbi:MAG: PKD domain-containing protein [Thermoplasmata archaeon]|nr:MAG: PKD domain-containing protein [Thermoplasmata archaeon]
MRASDFDGVSWEKWADENGAIPVLDVGAPGGLDYPWAGSPEVIRDDDVLLDGDPTNDDELYKMWYNGNSIQEYYTFRIFYATSSDGINWNKYVDVNGDATPVIDLGGAPGGADDASAQALCVVKEAGLYKMWYSAQAVSTDPYKTLYATSNDGISWAKHGLVLDVGATGERDERDAYSPQVIIDDNALPLERYKMWYMGQTQSGPFKFFYATSPDGLSWTKYSDALGAIPVLEPGGAPGGYDDSSVGHACVIKDNNGKYRMWYHGASSVGFKILYAESTDGILWTKHGLAVDVGQEIELDSDMVGKPTVLKDADDRYKMWYEGAEDGIIRIFYAYSKSENLPPVADAGIDKIVYEGDEVQLDGSNSYDIDGTIVNHEWDIDTSDGLCWDLGLPPDAEGEVVTHTYNTSGIYIATLNVTDDNGSYALATCSITVLKHPTLYINISQNRNDVILSWDPPSNPGIDYYLIYRSESQVDFDFDNPWVNTSVDCGPGESGPIFLRTVWNDSNAALPSNETNYKQQYYYILRSVNIHGGMSRTSRTVGKWTRCFLQGVSSFSLPLTPIFPYTIDDLTTHMNASYIKYMDPIKHIWMSHDLKGGENNNTIVNLGAGYEVKFAKKTNYTFTGMPGAMIIYDDDNGLTGFDPYNEAKNLTVNIEPNGDVNLTWDEPPGLGPWGYYEVSFSHERDGFFGTLDLDYFSVCDPVAYGTNGTIHTGAKAPDGGTRLYYMVVPFDLKGTRCSATYSIGLWTEDYCSQYDTFGIPLKMNENHTADWYCDNIPETVGMNYHNDSAQRWCWHSARMPAGAYDPTIIMTEGYQISTANESKFTFMGI